jgi:diguanylate cyclase (GGDEF)-like protein
MARDGDASPLEDTTRTAPAPVETTGQKRAAYLLMLSGSNVGEMHRLEKDQVIVGRSDKADIRLIDDGISREHIRVVDDGGQMWLEDLGSTNGTYCNGERVERRALVEGDKILLGSTTILKFTYQDRLEEAFQRRMSESALRDGLTRAYNKRYFTERLELEVQHALRHDSPLSLVFIDIDHFKQINDVHGHPAGDQVLTQLATVIMSMLEEEEVFARYGGEEFAIIARGTGTREARALSERVRASIESHPFTFDGTRIPVTISVGIARAPGPGIADMADLITRADEAMYEAKHAGRNRVVIADGATHMSGPVSG